MKRLSPDERRCAPDDPRTPFDALARAGFAGAAGGRRLLAWLVGRSFARLGLVAVSAMIVGDLVMNLPVNSWLVAAVPGFLAGIVLLGIQADTTQARAEADVATGLRREIGLRLDAMSARQIQAIPTGHLVAALQRHPGAIAGLVIGHRAAASMMVVGPLLSAAALAAVSWQAAVAVLALTPIMIVFFALVGGTIRKRADAQEQAFGHLAGQFADRIRTLPTILANHAVVIEEGKLAKRLRAYANNTMGVLRVAFLNAGLIDFFSSLSIAMLAVFLGLGHLGLANIPGFSSLALWQSLFILMVAPEYFAPFRRFSEQYHAKAEGEAAAAALDGLLAPGVAHGPQEHIAQALQDRDALPARGLVAVTGPSGTGKTTLLRRLAGVDGERPDAAFRNGLAWVSVDSFVPEGTLGKAIAWGAGERHPLVLSRVAEELGLLDERYLPGGLSSPVTGGGANLSGGQRLRIAVARALLSDRPVLADEPTAKLDAVNAARVRSALRTLAAERLVVVATHDPELMRNADRRIDLSAMRDPTVSV